MVEPSEELKLVFDKAINDAKRLQHEYVTVEHLVYAIFCEENFLNMIKMYGADIDYIKSNIEHHLKNECEELKTEETKFKPRKTVVVEKVLNRAFTQTLFMGRNTITLTDVILSVLNEDKVVSVYYLEKSRYLPKTF